MEFHPLFINIQLGGIYAGSQVQNFQELSFIKHLLRPTISGLFPKEFY